MCVNTIASLRFRRLLAMLSSAFSGGIVSQPILGTINQQNYIGLS
jgi:hypothetical protein